MAAGIDLRPTAETYLVMKGDPWSLKCGAGTQDDPEDLTDATITAVGKGTKLPRAQVDLTVQSTPESLAAGEFWVGIDAVVEDFEYAVLVAPSGGLPLTRWRGKVKQTPGADD